VTRAVLLLLIFLVVATVVLEAGRERACDDACYKSARDQTACCKSKSPRYTRGGCTRWQMFCS
ncbi:hypothetical protein PFISCL1PPCAC_4213, partial [Pristionchus fissidentatus]